MPPSCWRTRKLFESPPFWMWIVGFLLLLGPLVTLHELGHYLVGRWFGVKAEAFSIGFGKELWGRTDRRGTRWKLAAIPLGGYVQFKGDMNPASIPDPDAPAESDTFQSKSLWQRALIVFAGPATNLLITVAIFASFNLAYGKYEANNAIDSFAEESVAQEAGMEVGDRIVSIDGYVIEDFADIGPRVLMYPGKEIEITFVRDGREQSLPIAIGESIETDQFGNESRVGRLGVYSGAPQVVSVGPVESVTLAFEQSWGLVKMMVTGIAQIFTGDRSLQELGGPIKIAKYSGEQLSLGPQAFVSFAALISINLAFINLLPIPALDGGHLAFYAAEAIRRKPVSARGMEWAYRTGVALVLMLMVVVTVNDLISLPLFGS
ncbi:site-2 protease. Metallo peptidase. MEROPS family M50B [Altererythrobacter xiamenensis]|uniref:Zinc metalloprotease n=1 Tax=Altererythrobacter xiamenensis TaxID=1316679 RepID=A0A1Y6FN64_9SPHN|nr:site-2 protease. Metallo peptidase. MEROPS family M50B [Altererythrobacter xiamenensis]